MTRNLHMRQRRPCAENTSPACVSPVRPASGLLLPARAPSIVAATSAAPKAVAVAPIIVPIVLILPPLLISAVAPSAPSRASATSRIIVTSSASIDGIPAASCSELLASSALETCRTEHTVYRKLGFNFQPCVLLHCSCRNARQLSIAVIAI
jgi:hypothetical protein